MVEERADVTGFEKSNAGFDSVAVRFMVWRAVRAEDKGFKKEEEVEKGCCGVEVCWDVVVSRIGERCRGVYSPRNDMVEEGEDGVSSRWT